MGDGTTEAVQVMPHHLINPLDFDEIVSVAISFAHANRLSRHRSALVKGQETQPDLFAAG